MATIAENLLTAKTNFAQQLADISANPKPSYTVDGKSYQWGEYLKYLQDSMNAIDIAIQSESGPEEVCISGVT